jgi:hypothetical protein
MAVPHALTGGEIESAGNMLKNSATFIFRQVAVYIDSMKGCLGWQMPEQPLLSCTTPARAWTST